LTGSAQNTLDTASEAGPSATSHYQSVGQQLRAAREAARLSLDEVAHALKFSPRQIEALEADNFDALPGATIVRGFVRGYARLLRLDADALLRQLEPVMPSIPAEVRPPGNMGVASQPRGVRELSPLVTIAIVLLLAASMLVLWHFFGPSTTRTMTTANAPVNALEAPLTQPVPAESQSMPVVAPLVPTGEGAMPTQMVLPPDVGLPTLRFAFADRSWVEVTDASRQLLHSGENPGGSQLTLTGKPPFEIVVGNAGKVTLTYGEKVVDLMPHMRAEVARLTLE
jgi:cytoskeleton protein RodZ